MEPCLVVELPTLTSSVSTSRWPCIAAKWPGVLPAASVAEGSAERLHGCSQQTHGHKCSLVVVACHLHLAGVRAA
jgi:hypothetical protein